MIALAAMSETDNPIMLSALQHWSYCPRLGAALSAPVG
jgi:hypothetical protein